MPCSPVYAGSLYPCELTDAEWVQLEPLLPGPARRGRPRAWPLRLLVNALCSVLRTGCAWRALPREYPPWQTASTTFRQWRRPGVWPCVHEALRRAVRLRAGRHADPSAAIMDSQRVKTTEASDGIKGYDGGQQVKGRKRHILGGHAGAAAVGGCHAGPYLRPGGSAPLTDRAEAVRTPGWNASGLGTAPLRGEPLAPWCAAEGAWRLEIITPTPHVKGFVVRPWCWIVERTLGWLGRQRRLSKD